MTHCISTRRLGLVPLFLVTLLPLSASAEPTLEDDLEFVTAETAVKQPTEVDSEFDDRLGQFSKLMAENIVDRHVSYGVESSGKENFVRRLRNGRERMRSYKKVIHSIELGINTATVRFDERSSYMEDGALTDYDGQMLWVLRYDDDGLVDLIYRFHDGL